VLLVLAGFQATAHQGCCHMRGLMQRALLLSALPLLLVLPHPLLLTFAHRQKTCISNTGHVQHITIAAPGLGQ
jgi:hypothetical protein